MLYRILWLTGQRGGGAGGGFVGSVRRVYGRECAASGEKSAGNCRTERLVRARPEDKTRDGSAASRGGQGVTHEVGGEGGTDAERLGGVLTAVFTSL